VDWLADHSPIISAVDGVVELAVAILILLGVRARLGRIAPFAWLIVSYFLIEALVSFNRVFVLTDQQGTLARVVILEMVGSVIILLILAYASRIAGAIAFVVDEARFRAAEYARARYDYTQVVRHRIANPLTIIKGASQTLDIGELNEEMRHALRLAIYQAAQQLEEISLEPTRQGDEEHEFDAVSHAGPLPPPTPSPRKPARS
jgi:signal transduction histidine kinase